MSAILSAISRALLLNKLSKYVPVQKAAARAREWFRVQPQEIKVLVGAATVAGLVILLFT